MIFNSLLIANRGEIACRIIKTARDMGIRSVAVYVDADKDALFVKEADEAIRLDDGGYLDSKQIINAAKKSGAQAIHPGYGFLSENASFARKVKKEGIQDEWREKHMFFEKPTDNRQKTNTVQLRERISWQNRFPPVPNRLANRKIPNLSLRQWSWQPWR